MDGIRGAACRWLTEGAMECGSSRTGKAKDTDSLPESQTEHSAANNSVLATWDLHLISNLQNFKIINLCNFKPKCMVIITTAIEHSFSSPSLPIWLIFLIMILRPTHVSPPPGHGHRQRAIPSQHKLPNIQGKALRAREGGDGEASPAWISVINT